MQHHPVRPDWEHEATFHVDGLSCRHCARHAEAALRSLPGIHAASVRFSGETARVVHDARITDERDIVTRMAHRGYWLSPTFGVPPSERAWFDGPRLGVVLALVGNLLALAFWPPARTASKLVWVELVFALLLIAVAAPPLFTRALTLARRGHYGSELIALSTSVVSLALGLSCLAFGCGPIPTAPNFLLRFSSRPDGVAVLAFEAAGAIVGFALVGLYVHAALVRTAFADLDRATRSRYARVRRVTSRGGDEVVPCAVLMPGDRVRLVAGEVAPVDLSLDIAARIAVPSGVGVDRTAGQLLARGERLLSPTVTGRIEKQPGTDVAAAADAVVERATLRLDHEARERAGHGFDSIASLSLSVATISFTTFALIVYTLLAGGSFHPGIILAAITVLAGTSQAGFVLGLPLARMIAVLRARSAGIVVRDPAALDALAHVTFACFDKTGTLTLGAPHVTHVSWLQAPDPSILADVAALEGSATHPAGRAIARHLAAMCIEPSRLDGPPLVRTDGVVGYVRGALVEVSSAKPGDPLPRQVRPGASVVCFRREGQVLGAFELVDPVRPDALHALRALWHRGIACRILSSDSAEATLALAHRLGMTGFGQLRLEDKAVAVQNLRNEGARVLHVGDGSRPIEADVPVAMTPGVLAPDARVPVVLHQPNLHALVWLVDLARALRTCSRRMLGATLAYNAIVIPFCAAGFMPPMGAAALSLGASLITCILASRMFTIPPRSFARDKLTLLPASPRPTRTEARWR